MTNVTFVRGFEIYLILSLDNGIYKWLFVFNNNIEKLMKQHVNRLTRQFGRLVFRVGRVGIVGWAREAIVEPCDRLGGRGMLRRVLRGAGELSLRGGTMLAGGAVVMVVMMVVHGPTGAGSHRWCYGSWCISWNSTSCTRSGLDASWDMNRRRPILKCKHMKTCSVTDWQK